MHSPALIFLQLSAVLAACQITGWVCARLRQPRVIGEIVAGVCLGPSVLGALWPTLEGALFPQTEMAVLRGLSQLGIVFYVFLMGVEFDAHLIRKRLPHAAAVSAAGMLTPFLLALALAVRLRNEPALFPLQASAWREATFFAIAMSITAFPVLARIVEERGLKGTPLGTLVLGCGAVDDAAAWLVLMLLLANSRGGGGVMALVSAAAAILYVVVALTWGRRAFAALAAREERAGSLGSPMLAGILIAVFCAAAFTDLIGMHQIFGAFVLGLAVPRGNLGRDLVRTIQPLATTLLLPLFFAWSGLNTRVGLISSGRLFGVLLVILITACVGKGGACWLAARATGATNREAMAVGSLMNARGLAELIVLNIGLEQNLITPALFTIMVIMAVVTTFMAAPMYDLVSRGKQPSSW